MALIRVRMEIKGTTPLLMNRFHEEAQEGTKVGGKKKKKREIPPEEDARMRLHIDEDGQIIMPEPNLRACFIEVGREFQYDGRRKYATAKTSVLSGEISFDKPFYPIKGANWKVDTRPIVNPATGGRHLRHRPRFDDWSVSFVFEYNDEVVPDQTVLEMWTLAGHRVGICDFRPAKKGCFGKYLVSVWEPLDVEELIPRKEKVTN